MPKGDMGYDQYTFPYTIAVETAFFLLSFSTRKRTTMACRTILMKFLWMELKITHITFRGCTVERTFPTTCLEIAV